MRAGERVKEQDRRLQKTVRLIERRGREGEKGEMRWRIADPGHGTRLAQIQQQRSPLVLMYGMDGTPVERHPFPPTLFSGAGGALRRAEKKAV